jgi:hypothetical protein
MHTHTFLHSCKTSFIAINKYVCVFTVSAAAHSQRRRTAQLGVLLRACELASTVLAISATQLPCISARPCACQPPRPAAAAARAWPRTSARAARGKRRRGDRTHHARLSQAPAHMYVCARGHHGCSNCTTCTHQLASVTVAFDHAAVGVVQSQHTVSRHLHANITCCASMRAVYACAHAHVPRCASARLKSALPVADISVHCARVHISHESMLDTHC